MVSRAFRIISVLVLLVAAAFLTAGGIYILRQHDRITRYQPVPVTIEKSEVKARRGSKSTTYTPIIEYSYLVDGRPYQGNQILPGSEGWSRRSANRVVARHPLGTTSQAFFDPAAPGQSFLEKRRSFQPYFFCLLGAGLSSLAAALWFSGRRKPGHQQDAEPHRIGNTEWWPLTPEYEVARRVSKWRFAALALIALAFIPAHYFVTTWPDPGPFAFACGLIYTALTLVLISIWMHASSVSRRFIDPIVLIDRPDPMTGEDFTARVTVSVMKHVTQAELLIGIVCREGYREKRGGKTQFGERTIHQHWLPSEPVDQLATEGVVCLDFVLAAPSHKPPSTNSPITVYPNYTWVILINVNVKGGANLSARYPVVIAPGEAPPNLEADPALTPPPESA